MASPKPFNVAIIGGGISGLTLATGLLQHNIPLTIYEAAPSFSEIGAGVAFGPNAALAMKLLSPKIYAAFEKCKTANQWESKSDSWFTVRVGDARKADKDGFVRDCKKVGDALFDMKFGNDRGRGGVYRAHFLDELVKEIPDGVAKFGKKLTDISLADDKSGDMICHFADGTQARHNAVIGCDGIKSASREWMFGKDDPVTHPVFSGKYAYRGLIPMDQAIETLGEEVAKNSQMFFGYGGHVLTFPIEKGRTMNVVAFSSCKEWKDEKWVVTTTKEEMNAEYAAWGPHVQKIVHAMQKPDIWALFYHLPCSTYYKGRVCLLGDAAHATTPHQGAGAGMCMEDALIMSILLKEVKGVDDFERAFKAFDEVRRPRTQKNVITSKEAGMLYDFEGRGIGDDLEKLEPEFRGRMRWLWDVDLDEEIERARKIYFGATSKI
ncbi:mannitol 1-phosphate dehydrogenase 2 [Byssothecium circinans]|uniref:Mannitol 1-phosphate dehydrogenase 2 n=1 Tax=Byssothecium circinans TaxID=147558 RepID=A0A6A5T5L7_9PLEO|nr:mannitol 1-phosphate dehydrogenase 2 [Byssothecium circinans]KAF1948245.1 mannitol 1-phosphate dehydrogenase 2 [Byssothecium circinans]